MLAATTVADATANGASDKPSEIVVKTEEIAAAGDIHAENDGLKSPAAPPIVRKKAPISDHI